VLKTKNGIIIRKVPKGTYPFVYSGGQLKENENEDHPILVHGFREQGKR
jgi:hypothetical protein